MSKTATEAQSDALTLAAWSAMGEDDPGELVNGRLVEEEVPDFVHEVLVAFLIWLLRDWTAPRGGMVAGSDAKFAIGPRSGRKPDITVFLPGRPLPPRRGVIHVPPDIAVEVVSPTPRDGRRDRVEKVDDYAAFGIRYYWIIDPELRTVEILTLAADGRYAHTLGVTSGVVSSVPGCEGLTLNIDAMWTEIDRLPPAVA